jgi:hypothetical protein
VCGSAPTNSMRQHAGMGRPARAGHTRTRRQDTQGRLAARHSARRWNGGRYVFRGEAAGQRPFVACRSGQVTSEAVGAAVLQALRFSLRIRRLGVRMPSGARCWLRQHRRSEPRSVHTVRGSCVARVRTGHKTEPRRTHKRSSWSSPRRCRSACMGCLGRSLLTTRATGAGRAPYRIWLSADAASRRTVLTSLCHLGCTADVHLFYLE